MPIFSRNKNEDKLILVFYIGSSFVGGALFLTQKSGIPKIIFSVREPIVLEENIEAERFLFLTLQSLEAVAGRIFSAGLGAPKEIFCVLSSLWYVSQTRIVRLQKNMPFLFTSKLADGLIKKETVLFEEENFEKYLAGGQGVRLIELKNIKMMLNGYETLNPLNQKANDLEMTLFISMSGEKVLSSIEETIRKLFHLKEIKFSSFALSSFAVVRDMYVTSENFLLVTVGGEVTDISMIKKNVLRESISFPLGINFMIRRIASVSNCSLAEAESCISLLKDEHAAKSLSDSIAPAVNKLKIEWLSKFQESLSKLSNDISVPSTIFLSIDKDMAPFFSDLIKSEQFNQYILTESKFEIIFLGAQVFHGLAEFEENVIRDTFLISSSIYISRFLINPVSASKLGKADEV